MPRFFVGRDDIEDNIITVRGDDAYHIARSLRMAAGDSVILTAGEGVDYLCTLERIRDEECLCRIEEERASAGESPVRVTLYMAYPKGDKMETVTQKAVELGASGIVPFESERCIKRPPADKADKLTARLSRIAEEAAKQCGRSRLPRVHAPVKFSAMLKAASAHSLTLFCYEGEGARSLRSVLEERGEGVSDIGVIVGSEGGFSPREAEEIIAAGCECVNLGPRILRCETAPDYVLSAISYHYEL